MTAGRADSALVDPHGRIDWQAVAAACGGETWHTGGGCMAVAVDLPNGGRIVWASEASLPLFWDPEDEYGADVEDAAGDYVGSFIVAGHRHARIEDVVNIIRALAAPIPDPAA